MMLSTDQERKQRIRKFFQREKRLPTYDECTKLFHLKSKGSIHKYIKKFLTEGFLNKTKTGQLIPTGKFFELRLLGSIKAGFPSPAEEEMLDAISLDDYLIQNPQGSYLLKVTGDSMIEAGIMEGDLVIVDRGRTPKNDDVVVAEVDNEWTIKYFEKRGKSIRLRPANKNYPTISPKEELKIIGVVTSVIRKYL